jgi:hypothetical protein
MVATRRKRAADGSSSEEEENPQDADFTVKDDCNFCNSKKIPLLDARTTVEYELYQGRLYVNCTTFP